MGAKIGRNDPCPCGSGKKYKHCHLNIDKAVPSFQSRQALQLHDLDDGITKSLIKFASKRFGEEWTPGQDIEEMVEDDPYSLSFFVPWSLYHFKVAGKPVVDWYLEEEPKRIRESERAWLQAQRRSWISLWEINEVKDDVGVEVHDLLTGQERFVYERSGSKALKKRDAIMARVVDINELSVFCGIHVTPLKPSVAAAVVRDVQKELELPSYPISVERIKQEGVDDVIIDMWQDAVDTLNNSFETPQLKNTDGDDLLLTTDYFDLVKNDRSQLQRLLTEMEGTVVDGREAKKVTVTFNRLSNSMHKSWDNTLIGHAELTNTELKVDTNSIKRADDLRARLETSCKDMIRHRIREHSDPSALLNDARFQKPKLPNLNTEEEMALIRKFKDQHYADWLDQPIEALHGKTPREAARNSDQRKEVELLLKDMENMEERLPLGERFDFSALRQQLGL